MNLPLRFLVPGAALLLMLSGCASDDDAEAVESVDATTEASDEGAAPGDDSQRSEDDVADSDSADASPTTEPAGPGSTSSETTSPVVVPDLVEMPESEATAILVSLGINDITYIEQPSLGVEGRVLSQLPEAGSQYQSGPVTITYSIPLPEMPDLVGMRVGEAESLLEEWGVAVRTELQLSNERPDGEVLASVPPPGDRVGSEVQLTVAAAPVTGLLGSDDAPFVDYVSNGRSYSSYSSKPVEVNGELYEKSLIADLSRYTDPGDTVHWEYNLGRDWNQLESIVGITDDSVFEQRARFRVILDGDVIWEQDDVAFGQTVPVSLDISNGLRLRLEVVALDRGKIGMAWGSPRLLGVEGVAGAGQ